MPEFLIRVQWADGREPASENFIRAAANAIQAWANFKDELDYESSVQIKRFTVAPLRAEVREPNSEEPSEEPV